MKRILLSGANGAMGHEIASCINNRSDCKVVAGLDINTACYGDFPIFKSTNELTCSADVIIDFSHVSVLTPLLQRLYCGSGRRIKRGFKTNSCILFPQYVIRN